jgi:site-specific recombinase XerD
MNRLLKFWVAEAGLDPRKYGNESLRRTKAFHILNSTGDLETVRVLLGHILGCNPGHIPTVGDLSF